ncbi:MAG: 1-deoxy-D-xylulose-5-phosphate reductoisomerase, partial [Candidatus Bipolaricaulota bacterium]
MNTRRLAVLGATGSIGAQALDVLRTLKAEGYPISVTALAAGSRVDPLVDAAREFGARAVGVAGPTEAAQVRERLASEVEVVYGSEGLTALARRDDVDLVLNAVVGAAGLVGSLAALEAGKSLALANKESLVAGGELVRSTGAGTAGIVAVDSEHAGLQQALQGGEEGQVERLWITASGGAFRNYPSDALEQVTPREALNHPTWRMGPRITVDSATLVNKAFEVIEAHHLFNAPWEKIGVLLHPQSVIHALVELVDGTLLAQMGPHDMRIPIRYALTHPERLPDAPARLSLADLSLELSPLPSDRYPAFWSVVEAGKAGGTAPAVANAADEVLVAAFLEGRISF